MERQEKKHRFIMMRAEGMSHDRIAKALRISKSTSSTWGKELEAEIRKQEAAHREEAYNTYKKSKEDYLRLINSTLSRIDKEIDQRDFSEIPLEKLLKLKLDYADRLQAHNSPPPQEAEVTEGTTAEVLKAVIDVYRKVAEGTISTAEAKGQVAILTKVQQARREIDLEKVYRFEG